MCNFRSSQISFVSLVEDVGVLRRGKNIFLRQSPLIEGNCSSLKRTYFCGENFPLPLQLSHLFCFGNCGGGDICFSFSVPKKSSPFVDPFNCASSFCSSCFSSPRRLAICRSTRKSCIESIIKTNASITM